MRPGQSPGGDQAGHRLADAGAEVRGASRLPAPASISSAATSRTRSRRARSPARQPATIGIPHHFGIPPGPPTVSRTCNLRH